MNTELADKVVLIIGASGGIGSAIARAFAQERARVVLHYHGNRAGTLKLQCELKPAEALVVGANLTNETQVQRLFRSVRKKFGRVDTLVANAGAWEMLDVPLHEMSLRQWRATFDGVLTSAFLSVREFCRIAARQKRGNAVLIGSMAAVFGEAGHADYAAAKAAMAFGLTRSLKNELARLAPYTREYCGGRGSTASAPAGRSCRARRASSWTERSSAESPRRCRCQSWPARKTSPTRWCSCPPMRWRVTSRDRRSSSPAA